MLVVEFSGPGMNEQAITRQVDLAWLEAALPALVDVVHRAALDHGLPALDGLRTRAVGREHYRIADGQPDHAFIAISARIGPGRDAEAKTTFLEEVLHAAVVRIDSEGGPLAIAWSIELTEIDPEFRINRNLVRARLQAQQDLTR